MIILSVEVQVLLIGKLRNMLRIAAGLVCVRGIREFKIRRSNTSSGDENAPFISLYTTPLIVTGASSSSSS